ncbi:glycosyltransferase family 1 protein [Rathayibacter sp. VKM Ac-2760]|uniref:glycosyltransferase family 4 protein n=1 Tax=Rathayibacter sp. VKM Ac-2760 TaxID=2609253 RepID=UPI00131662E5|nr:glycosyltransferase family 1 protein [Rathayibacter sp. VKM Ac-2760]QHC59477.1 glycosyltransferase [Rathayibacter sp. VKM Ac-2760]
MSAARGRLLVDATALAAPRLTGVGRVLLGILRALDTDEVAARAEVLLVLPASEARALERFRFRTLRVRPVRLPRRLWSALTRLPAPGIDLLLGRGAYFFPNFRNWPLARSRSMTFVHDVCFAVLPELVPRERRELLGREVPRWLARTDVVLTGTPSSAREITSSLGVDADRVRVLPTTIDAEIFRPRSAAEIERVRAGQSLGRYLLFVGSIERRKNLVTLVDAYARAERPTGHTLLLVGGDGWDNAEVHAAVARAVALGAAVRFASGYVPDEDLPALLSGADAVAMPSWHEGFGLPALEAVACGTPVLAADIPGLRDALAGREEDAVFLPPADEEAWVVAIEAALRSPRRIPARQVPGWDRTARLLLELALR